MKTKTALSQTMTIKLETYFSMNKPKLLLLSSTTDVRLNFGPVIEHCLYKQESGGQIQF